MRKLPVILIPALVLSACSLLSTADRGEPLARVYDEYLYKEELSRAIPDESSDADSSFLAKRYIENWVKDRLMLHRATETLSEEQMDFEEQLEEYHRSLLLYTYRKLMLQQKLDTLVREAEIQAYYEENRDNFLLGQDIIKGSYVKLPLSSPRIEQVRRWSWTNSEEALVELEKYCMNYAESYSDFNERWVNFSAIRSKLPMRISNPTAYLNAYKNIETTDSLYRYFVHVSDHLPEGSVKPIELVSEDIRDIILNKRRIEFVQDLEQRVYSDGLNRNQFEIYK